MKIGLVVSHPIQHFCPQYASFAKISNVELKVFFASALGYKKYMDPNFKREISWSNLRLEQFDHVFLNGEVALASDNKIDAHNLEEQLTSYSPEVVIIYGYFQKLQRRAHRWARYNQVPLAYISDAELRHRRSRPKEWLKFLFLRWYFSKINWFLSVGDANEEYYRYHGVEKKKIVRMHFPIDIEHYEESFAKRLPLREMRRAQYNIDDTALVLSVVGKLVPWKNQDHLIDALALLEEEGIVLHLFIIGSGDQLEPWKEKTKMLTKSKVHFTGFVDALELPSFYAASDIYVHPAAIEPHSIAISEAIYMGCPVILSDRCGSYGDTDDVREGKNGYVFPFGDIRQLAACIERLASDPSKRASFSLFSRELAMRFQQSAHRDVMLQLQHKLQHG